MATRKRAAGKTPAQQAAGENPPARPPGKPTQSDPRKKPFTPEVLDRSAIAKPLQNKLEAEDEKLKNDPDARREIYPVIIDLHLEYPGGRKGARKRVGQLLEAIFKEHPDWPRPANGNLGLSGEDRSEQYLFGKFEGRVIRELVRRDRGDPGVKTGAKARAAKVAVYRIWPDFEVSALVYKSVSTIKADAALNSFSTTGDKIVWAVMDSGIDALHPHFAKYDNLNLTGVSLRHRDLTVEGLPEDENELAALTDRFGHGTHVAGIIAGSMTAEQGDIVAKTRFRDEKGDVQNATDSPPRVAGIAPRCKLLSLKVLDDAGDGRASSLIAAIAEIQRINGYGRFIRVHGVNMSVGYDFEPEWFACGQSPLCVEVNRLVQSGVVVVVAAGNTGYGFAQSASRGTVAAGLGLHHQRPRQRRAGDHGRAPRTATCRTCTASRTFRRRARPATAAPSPTWWRRARRSSRAACNLAGAARCRPQLGALKKRVAQWGAPAAPAAAAAATREAGEIDGELQGRQRHQHGGAARVGRHRGVPVGAPRVHRGARASTST